MSSKSRGGLSKREYAAKQASLSAPKKTTSSKSSSSSSQWGFDPEAYTRDIYNALPASSPAKMSAAQHPGGFKEEEKKAKKAKSSPKPIVNTSQRTTALPSLGGGGSWASNARENPTIQRLAGQGQFSSGQFANGAGGYGIEGASTGTGGNSVWDELKMALGGIPTANAQTIRGTGSNLDPEIFNALMTGGIGNELQNQFISAIKGMPQLNYENANNEPAPQPQPKQNVSYGNYAPAQTQEDNLDVQYAQQQQGMLSKQAKAQEKAFKQQKKAQEKALKQLLADIETEYGTSQKEGTTKIDQSKIQQLMQLTSMFNAAGADPGDEQAMQYRQRAQDEAAYNLAQFLEKLQTGKATDIRNAKNKFEDTIARMRESQANAMSSIEEQKMSNQYKLAKLLAQINKRKYAYSAPVSEEDDWTNW